MTTTKIVSSNAAYNDEYMRKKRLNLDFQAREKACIEAWSNGVPSHLRPKIGYKTVKYGPENSPENIKQFKKEQLEAKAKQTIICECGCECRKDGLSKHIKTNKHEHLLKMKKDPV